MPQHFSLIEIIYPQSQRDDLKPTPILLTQGLQGTQSKI